MSQVRRLDGMVTGHADDSPRRRRPNTIPYDAEGLEGLEKAS